MKQLLRSSGLCAIIVLISATVITTVIRVARAAVTISAPNATVTFPTAGSTFNVNQIFPISSNHTISFSRTVDSPDHGDRVGAIVKNGTTQGGVDTLVTGTGASHSWGAGTSGTWTYTQTTGCPAPLRWERLALRRFGQRPTTRLTTEMS
jgi:hypothetical protein